MESLWKWIEANCVDHDERERQEYIKREEEREAKAKAQKEMILKVLGEWGIPLPIDQENWTGEGYLRFGRLVINYYKVDHQTIGLNTVENGHNNFHPNAESLALFLRDYLNRQSGEDAFANG